MRIELHLETILARWTTKWIVRGSSALAVLVGSLTSAGPAHAQVGARCGTGIHAEEGVGLVLFPEDVVFCGLLADPKQPGTALSLLRGEFPGRDDPGDATMIGSVGLGDRFGLARWNGATVGNGLQLDVEGAIFAQFDLDTPSFDLINADYIVGLPLTLRVAGFSTRLRLYHQSSHLGDEYLLRGDIERENISYESVELILSQEVGAVRLYGGGEVLVRRDPETLDETVAHGGIELRSKRAGPVRFVTALDVKAAKEQDWAPGWSASAGIELARSPRGGHPLRLVQLLGEFYHGPSPYGQFFQEEVTYAGVGLRLGF